MIPPHDPRPARSVSRPASVAFESAAAFGLADTADLLHRGFEDYFVKLAFSPRRLLELARCDSVDLDASRIVRLAGHPVGVALVARRGWTSRLAGMALLPSARRQGLGRQLMRQVLTEAAVRGDRAMVLEVIEQNAPALGLYLACGFHQVRRLVGFLGHAPGDRPAIPDLNEVDLRSAAEAVARHSPVDLPWQLSAETIAQLTPPSRAYAGRGAWIVFTPASATQMAVRALVSEAPSDTAGAARDLLATVMRLHPGHSWRMTAIWPEEQSIFFHGSRFESLNLTQWQLRQPLCLPRPESSAPR